ncbi:MAG: histidine kinase dimerization/phosphoacceptor domain -containing protein [Phenylobacterium sp.]|uniref:sensor histidine kinase n=1 Tax=Phenylobacterium sp. TaxID=1871053 RepID=UPI00272F4E2C|nr:PAS domain-containing sensor histidine kinase [Phenylobacterium sp.]MDP2011935.1 histidine kinase dimerization/phosphoacceptor domain -containing protein [Phenylobacterium sp.]
MPDRPDSSLSLALAVVASSDSPLLLLDGDLRVIALSTSFLRAFGIDRDRAVGQPVTALGDGEWAVPQLISLLTATLSGAVIESYEMDLRGPGGARALVLHAQNLDYGDADNPRLLLSVSDVTEARLTAQHDAESLKHKDNQLREKAILLREVQHRVANSLQIIASVLLQSARKVQSDETRTHLKDAHNRVMSIAMVQQQLATASLEAVVLRPYLIQLCQSLAASMIRDPHQLSVSVTCDDSVIDANVSVSLGLIVTELVINALKHGFPGHRHGRILVNYESEGEAWTLSVRDNGVGMPKNAEASKPGLGTSIVEALANQLCAGVRITDAHPGTVIAIICSGLTPLDAAPRPEPTTQAL